MGGNRWQFYTRELRAYSLERLQLENQLRKAIDEDQLIVHFQPKLHLASDRIVSAEALVRWQHPDKGLVMPGDFITIAEETGMIVALGQRCWISPASRPRTGAIRGRSRSRYRSTCRSSSYARKALPSACA
ncbi:EAL domain-containing protein [Halopseudomonas pachastrellae]|nr:EAL domain-containing protein [Halopseudomonas pachastrellae]